MLALALADALLEALGGDTLDALRTPFAKLRLAQRTDLGHRYLIGPMGSGKSTAGALLAEQLGLPFIDLDSRIERDAGATIAQLFEREGEAAFRAREAAQLAKVAREPAAVVALGGGAALTEEAWITLRETGAVLRLTARPEVLVRRIGDVASRPLLAGGDPVERLGALLRERERWYARADATLDTEDLSAEAVAGGALGLFRALEGPLVARARANRG